MTLNERVRANERSAANACLGLAGLSFTVVLLVIGLITSTVQQQQHVSSLKTELQKKTEEIEKLQNRNSAQDIILNKLNAEYQIKEKQKAAWKFIKYLTTPERAAQWSVDTGYVATRKSAFETDIMKKYYQERPQAKVAFEQLKFAKPELTTYNAAEIWRILNDNIDVFVYYCL